MIRNFFLATIRNISRNKGFTFINVAGLAIGLAASLMITISCKRYASSQRASLEGEDT